ncbi:uncharacterized protein LOC143926950 [Lithobates pipiens]
MMGAVHVLLILGVLPGSLLQTVNNTMTIHVRQTPVIWATEGDSITLPCDYRIIGENASIGSYKWYRHIVRSGVEVSENNKNFTGRLSKVDQDQFFHGRSAAITLYPVVLSDSGMYYCEVTFQIGQQISGEGNGTFLNVTASANNGSEGKGLQRWDIIGGGIVGGVLLLSLMSVVVYCVYTKQASSPTQDVGPIVYTDFMTQRSTDVAHTRYTPQEQLCSDIALYSMENQHYTYFQHKDIRRTPTSPCYQEMDLYSVIP